MRKVYLTLATVAGMILAGCTSDEIVVDNNVGSYEGTETPIVFSSLRKGMTRADFVGAEAAEKLGNKFVVSGYKGDATATATVGQTVFDNYLVEYEENTANTANTTASNTNNWEYVGKGTIKHATDHGISSQTIKYWDYSKTQYDFLAWSTGKATAIYEGTPTAGTATAPGEVLVSAIETGSLGTQAYTFTGTARDLSECYVSDIVTVNKSGTAGVGEVSGYNQPVTLKFRALGTKVRIGIYETIPGYSVRDVKFYTAADVALAGDATDDTPKLFTTVANNIFTEGTYTVTFPTVDQPGSEDNNQAHVTFAPKTGTDQATTVVWGGLNYTIAQQSEKTTGEVFLGRTSNTASFAGEEADNYYVIYLPNEAGTNLNLRVNYTLESIDGSGETIEVKGATAQVPSIYTTWKPGFAYTYLFKISDKTNGFTGPYDPENPDALSTESNPAGLYPITFDAVVVNAEDNDKMQETITTVSAPSITTYQKGSNVVNQNEYVATTGDIFVTVNDTNDPTKSPDLANGDLQTLTGKAALYTIPAGKTEADVVDALQMQDDDAATGTIKGRSGLVLTEATSTLTNSIEYGVDGNAISVGTDQALRFTPAAGTYAFVYTKKAADPANDVVKYEALNWDSFATGQTKYRYDYKAPAATDAQKGVKYFAEDAGVYTMQTPFIGQGVSNLYLDNAGTTIATGYAATDTDYYYTVDGGMSYTKAANIAYADFAAATDLYTFDGTNYTAKTDATPVSGTAYYKKTVEDGVDVYTYCVILPQQTTGWFELDTTKYVVATETAKVDGQTYFDKYVQNDGVYYTKVIKVQ